MLYPEDQKPKQRFLFLFNDKLLIASKSRSSLGGLFSRDLKVKHFYDLGGILPISNNCLDPNRPTSFRLLNKYDQSLGTIVLISKTEQKEWIDAFNNAKTKLENQKKSLYQSRLQRSSKRAEEAKEQLTSHFVKIRERAVSSADFQREKPGSESSLPLVKSPELKRNKSNSLSRKTSKKRNMLKEIFHTPTFGHRRSFSEDKSRQPTSETTNTNYTSDEN